MISTTGDKYLQEALLRVQVGEMVASICYNMTTEGPSGVHSWEEEVRPGADTRTRPVRAGELGTGRWQTIGEANTDIEIPDNSVIFITNKCPEAYRWWLAQVVPGGTPIVDNVSCWPDLDLDPFMRPNGSLDAIVIGGHGACNGVATKGNDNDCNSVNLEENPYTAKLIHDKLGPNGVVILLGCASATTSDGMVRFANLAGHPVIGNLGGTLVTTGTEVWKQANPTKPWKPSGARTRGQ